MLRSNSTLIADETDGGVDADELDECEFNSGLDVEGE